MFENKVTLQVTCKKILYKIITNSHCYLFVIQFHLNIYWNNYMQYEYNTMMINQDGTENKSIITKVKVLSITFLS